MEMHHQYYLSTYFSILIGLALLQCRTSVADLCTNPNLNAVSAALKQGVVPRGIQDAGQFTRDKTAETMADCVASCCVSVDCEVMFFFSDTCLLISCNQSWPAGCDPIQSRDERFDEAMYLRVRTASEAAALQLALTTTSSTMSVGNCLIDGCSINEHCEKVMIEGNIRHVCRCIGGFVRDRTGSDVCVPISAPPSDVIGILSPLKIDSTSPTSIVNVTVETFGLNTTITTPDVSQESLVPPATTTKSSLVQPSIKSLVVSAGENHVIQLPVDSITLYSYVVSQPESDRKEMYKYQWSLFSHPDGDETGEMTDITSAALKLSKLRVGVYTFKVTVTSDGSYGEALVNVTVLPPSRINVPPVAVVKPLKQEVNQPNDVIIDGSASTDDDKIVSYHWELVSGKLGSQNSIDASDVDKAMLVLKGLAPGSYKFKLLVTDSDGAQNFTFADVTVLKETDYPPTANAGSNVIINLPQNSVTLYGNASTDDKGIVSYEWTQTSDDKLAADISGVRSPFLRLDKLVVGDYTFRLKVVDAAGQESTADVRVFVKPERNQPPVANAGTDRIIWLPVDTVVLDGSNSTDDQKIESYQWTLTSGSSAVSIENSDRVIATASKLKLGEYKFQLTVRDNEGLTNSATVTIVVHQNDNQAPVAKAGGDQTLNLPLTVVTLNGSKSSDDRGIVSYVWTRDASSPAAGTVVLNSDHTAVLQLVGLVSGRYVFKLEVTDEDGLKSSDTAAVVVKPETYQLNLVQMLLSVDIRSFTNDNRVTLESQLSLLLRHSSQLGESKVIIDDIAEDGTSGQTLITFYVVSGFGKQQEIRSGVEVVSVLRKKLRSSPDVIDYGYVSLETLVCQNNCSGHGQCSQATKRCICSGFWTEDIFRAHFGEGESNCDWSILYVIITIFVATLVVILILWGIICLCRRCSRWKPKVRRHRYTLLEDLDEERKFPNGKLEMLPSSKVSHNSSLMESESDLSSEETIFVNNKKPNGVITNNNTIGSTTTTQNKITQGASKTVLSRQKVSA